MVKKEKYFWVKQLRSLERHCNEKGFRVVCKSVDVEWIDYSKNLITISNKKSDEISLYILLHELGHSILFKNKNKYNKKYGYVFNNFSRNSSTHDVATIEEELDAWKEGLMLADTLGVYVDRRKWEITKAKAISSYATWIAIRKEKKKRKI